MFRLATLHWIGSVLYKEPCFNCCFSSLSKDDMQIRVFNYNTLERVHMFEAHSDYIRCIAVHPTQPFILTSSGKTSLVYFDIFLIICFEASVLCLVRNCTFFPVSDETGILEQVANTSVFISLPDIFKLFFFNGISSTYNFKYYSLCSFQRRPNNLVAE